MPSMPNWRSYHYVLWTRITMNICEPPLFCCSVVSPRVALLVVTRINSSSTLATHEPLNLQRVSGAVKTPTLEAVLGGVYTRTLSRKTNTNLPFIREEVSV